MNIQSINKPCVSAHWRPGMQDLTYQTLKWDFNTVLDIGTGNGLAAKYFLENGKKVWVTGYDMQSYSNDGLPSEIIVKSDIDVCDMSDFADETFDAVWCSHVIEHVQNVGLALREIRRILRPGGVLFVTVPEYAPVLVGGHVSTGWTVGTLMYNLILSGFNARDGEFINHCWNVAAYVERGDLPQQQLRYDIGDLETLADCFPPEFNVTQGMGSNVSCVNWYWRDEIREGAQRRFNQALRHRKIVDMAPPILMRKWRQLRTR